MPYSIDAANAAEPTDAREAGYMAAELRALKTRLNTKATAYDNILKAGGVPLSYLATTGTKDGTKFLRDDGAWTAISSAVTSFNGRTGAVVPAANDYSWSMLSGTPDLPAASAIGGKAIGFRDIPVTNVTSARALAAADRSTMVASTAALSIPTGLSAGYAFLVHNASTASPWNLTSTGGVQMRKVGVTTLTTTIEIPACGEAQILMLSSTLALVAVAG